MKTILALSLIVCCLLFTHARAQNPAYEASPGLIFVGYLMLYYDSEGPMSYQTVTPWELPKDAIAVGEVMGDSCQHGLSIPIIFSPSDRVSISGAAGDGSYRKAIRNIIEKHPDLDGLYDVKVDVHRMSILTIYSRDCTIVVAQGFKRRRSESTPSISSK